MRRGLSGWLQRLRSLLSITAFALSVSFALGAVFFLVAHLLEPGEGTSGVVFGLCLLIAVAAGSLTGLLTLLRPADADWSALRTAAGELRERYFELVFVDAGAEFAVWPFRHRHFGQWRVTEGLELAETGGLTEWGSSTRVGVRSRRILGRRWEPLLTVQEAERRLADELDRLLSGHRAAEVESPSD